MLMSQSLARVTWSGRSTMPRTTDLSTPDSAIWDLRAGTVLPETASNPVSLAMASSVTAAIFSGHTWV